MSSTYTFLHECEVCGSKPVLKATGMCSPCTYGEADSLWDWVNNYYVGRELKLAKDYIKEIYKSLSKSDLSLTPDLHRRLQNILHAPNKGGKDVTKKQAG